MAQHDFILDNNPGATFRNDLNAVLEAIATQNSGTTEPAIIYPGMMWLDTSVATLVNYPDGRMWQRNQSNSAWVAPGGSIGSNIKISVLTTSQTWTKPVGLKFLDAIAIGGGGGSTAIVLTAAAQGSASGGGGGGGAARKLYPATAITPTVVVTVGSGGAAGAAGTGTVFLGLTGNGGGVGPAIAAGTAAGVNGGAGGTATGGDLNVNGAAGGVGWRLATATYSQGGSGGKSMFASGVSEIIVTTTSAGSAGIFPGGGARGACNGASAAAAAGAAGAGGCVFLVEYY